MRDLEKVIDKMLCAIDVSPFDEDSKINSVILNFETLIKAELESIRYSAPEIIGIRWNETYNILLNTFFNSDTWDPEKYPWMEEIRKIWVGEDENE